MRLRAILADLDVHPRVAMQVLRHARFSVTMEIYTQVSSKATREASSGSAILSAADHCCTYLLYGSRKATSRSREVAFDLRGRYWDRTSDLFGVNEALSR